MDLLALVCRLGAAGVIYKPFRQADAVAAVGRALRDPTTHEGLG